MRAPVFRTRLTDLLGIAHPILCGGLGPGVSDANYVAAVVNAGAMGFIVAAGFPDPDEFRAQLRRCRDLTGGRPFGVNLYISKVSGGVERTARQLDILVEEGVACVETAGASPEPIMPKLKAAGIKVLHKIPAVKYARTAERAGADAVIIVGNECGGHPGIFQIGTMVQAAHGPATVSAPVVVGGGIGTGRQLVGALAMGAEGVIMGTRMIVAEELWISRAYKEHVTTLDGTESVIVKSGIRDQHRVLNNDSAKAAAELDRLGTTDFEAYRPYVMGDLARQAYRTGDWSQGMLDYGHAGIFADRVEPVEAIIDRIIDDAILARDRLPTLAA
jgi:NAD(P)H-dependent flavin oxidoreductase YrpB (nitropropane dioxygenase family)